MKREIKLYRKKENKNKSVLISRIISDINDTYSDYMNGVKEEIKGSLTLEWRQMAYKEYKRAIREKKTLLKMILNEFKDASNQRKKIVKEQIMLKKEIQV